MGQKVNPNSLRLGIIHEHESKWIAANSRDYAKYVLEDYKIRKFLRKKLASASVSKIEIDRKAQRLIIRIITGRPGMVVGRGGQGLDMLRKELQKLTSRKDIQLDVLEVARIDMDAQLVAESIAQQLEKRIAFRRAMKQSIQRAMRSGAKGIKVMVAGRLGGAEIARTEWAKEGRIPLHTFRADIHYATAEATTVFGIIGVKVWIFKGEVMPGEAAVANVKQKSNEPEGERQGFQAGRRGPGGPGGGGRGPGGSRPGGGRGGRGASRPPQQQAAPADVTPPVEKTEE